MPHKLTPAQADLRPAKPAYTLTTAATTQHFPACDIAPSWACCCCFPRLHDAAKGPACSGMA